MRNENSISKNGNESQNKKHKGLLHHAYEELKGGQRMGSDFFSLPPVEVTKAKENFLLHLVVHEFQKEHLRISIVENKLLISAEKKAKKTNNLSNEDWAKKEFTDYNFQRTFTLPEYTDVNNITAKYEEGILILDIPSSLKVESTKTMKRIKIV